MNRHRQRIILHLILLGFVALTLLPFVFVVNNSLRTTAEINRSFYGLPQAGKDLVRFTWYELTGQSERIELRQSRVPGEAGGDVRAADAVPEQLPYGRAMAESWGRLSDGYRIAWYGYLRPYTLNTFLVAGAVAFGVVLIGSVSAYVFSRYRFPGHKVLFFIILSFMMIPGVLTLVPSFLLVKELGLINSYWVLVLPYMAAGQVFAIFLFKGFFDNLPGDLFEAARLDGAGHFRLYWNIVLPLSRPIISVVLIVNILATWNNFLWPFVTNSDPDYHVLASGIYLMGRTTAAQNQSALYAGYVLTALPLLILFIYATKPFVSGVTSGAFKA